MQQTEKWQGLPYFPISLFYKQRFGGKVYKIPVSVAETCPNREGLNGMKTCNFCDVWGSAAYPEVREQDLRDQIERNKKIVAERVNAEKFLVYFQAYTSTYNKTDRLRKQFDVASEYDDVYGFVVGTRPDCLSDAVYELWDEYWNLGKFISVELGVQSFDEDQLLWMRRGHTAKKSLWAIDRIRKKTKNVDLGIHLIFGLPGETDQQIIETAKIVNDLPLDNVKIHNLHVLKNTPLAEEYEAGTFNPLTREEYVDRTILFLEHLRPEIAVHRIAALSTRADELLAPDWVARKMETYQFFLDRFKEKQTFQGHLL